MKIIDQFGKLFSLTFIAFIFTACGEPIEFRYSSSQKIDEEATLKREPSENSGVIIYNTNTHTHDHGHDCAANSDCCYCSNTCDDRGSDGMNRIFPPLFEGGEHYRFVIKDDWECSDRERRFETIISAEVSPEFGETVVYDESLDGSFYESGRGERQDIRERFNNSIGLAGLSSSLNQRSDSFLNGLLFETLKQRIGQSQDGFQILEDAQGNIKLVDQVTLENQCVNTPRVFKEIVEVDDRGKFVRVIRIEPYPPSRSGGSVAQSQQAPVNTEVKPEEQDGPQDTLLRQETEVSDLEAMAEADAGDDVEVKPEDVEVKPEDVEGNVEGNVEVEPKIVSKEFTFKVSDYVRKTRKKLDILLVISPSIDESMAEALGNAVQGFSDLMNKYALNNYVQWKIAVISSGYYDDVNSFAHLEPIPVSLSSEDISLILQGQELVDRQNLGNSGIASRVSIIEPHMFPSEREDYSLSQALYNSVFLTAGTGHQIGLSQYASYSNRPLKAINLFFHRAANHQFFEEDSDLAVVVVSNTDEEDIGISAEDHATKFLRSINVIMGLNSEFWGKRNIIPIGILYTNQPVLTETQCRLDLANNYKTPSVQIETALLSMLTQTQRDWLEAGSRFKFSFIVDICNKHDYFKSNGIGTQVLYNYYARDISELRDRIKNNYTDPTQPRVLNTPNLTVNIQDTFVEGDISVNLNTPGEDVLSVKVFELKAGDGSEESRLVEIRQDKIVRNGDQVSLTNVTLEKESHIKIKYTSVQTEE